MSRKRRRVEQYHDALRLIVVAIFAFAMMFVAFAINDRAHSATVVSRKTGAAAQVDEKYAAAFQAYVDDLERRGAVIREMGGWRRGRCSLEHQHSCGGGLAVDVCQLSRGLVRRDCKLPGRRELIRIAASHGLFEGGAWCSSDMGHVQARVTAPACGESIETTVASLAKLPPGATPAIYRAPARGSSCLTEAQARAHWPKDHLYWHGPDRCWDNSKAMPHPVAKANPLALPPERPPLPKQPKLAVAEPPPTPATQCPASETAEILRARGMALLIAAFGARASER